MTKKLDRDLIEHARDQLSAAAYRHVRGGMGPASAAYAAIRETKALFPSDWKLAVQGDNDDEFVEVWEVDHKYSSAIAMISREPEVVKKRASKRSHAIVRKTEPSSSGRWIHRSVAQSFGVPEDVVRRIYAAVQTAKHQGLYGGYMADLSERSVGRKLIGAEYTVYARAKEHLGYDPPGGYGGPQPKGSAKAPPRVSYDDPKATRARDLIGRAEATIKSVLRRRKHPTFGWDTANDSKDRGLLQQAANDLDVAADLYEEAGANISAGTLHERARLARHGDYAKLDAYA